MATTTTPQKLTVGLLIFDNVEVLDFCGPFEVFSRTRTVPGYASRKDDASAPFEPFTVAKHAKEISATGGLRVVPDYSFETAPKIDILLVPGGFGARTVIHDKEHIEWIQTVASTCQLVTSVCTGAVLLAQAGLLDGKRATSHFASCNWLASDWPKVQVDRSLRLVEDGDTITSAGVAAGIDMAFHVVERICGKTVADETAYYIEYSRRLATDPRSTEPEKKWEVAEDEIKTPVEK